MSGGEVHGQRREEDSRIQHDDGLHSAESKIESYCGLGLGVPINMSLILHVIGN